MSQVANVNVTRVRFSPGDKALVRVYGGPLNSDQVRKIKMAVQRWSGLGLDDILVFSDVAMEITIEPAH
jgi:hypothetical protein